MIFSVTLEFLQNGRLDVARDPRNRWRTGFVGGAR